MAAANPSTTTDDRSPANSPLDGRLASLGDGLLLKPLRAAAFWAAVVLPFVLLAALLGPGVGAGTLSGLVGANVAAVVVGHGYGR